MQEGAYIQKVLQSSEYCLLFTLLIFHLLLTLPFLSEGFPRGGDFFFHYFYITKAAEFVQHFTGFDALYLWNNYYNLGHPFFYYYQFFPYLISAIINQFFMLDTLLFFKLSIIIMYTLLPVSYYFCGRSLGLKKRYCLVLSGYFTFLSSAPLYERIGGLSYMSYFQYGSYTFLFATLFFPVAIAYGWKYYNEEKSFSKSFFFLIFSATITLLSHVLLGGILLLSLGILFLTKIVLTPRKKQLLIKTILLIFFLLLTTAITWLPALRTADYYGGLEEAGDAYTKGFGVTLGKDLLLGNLLDAYRLPFFTVFFFLGIGGMFLYQKKIREEIHESPQQSTDLFFFLVASIFISFFLAAGIATKAGVFFSLPASFHLFPMGKFITALQFFSGFFVCFGIGALVVAVEKFSSKVQRGHLDKGVLLLLFLLGIFFLFDSKDAFLYDPESYGFESGAIVPAVLQFQTDSYLQEFAAFMEKKEYGVLYYGNKTSTTHVQQFPEVLSFYAKKPVLLTGAGGFHETLSSYYAVLSLETLPLSLHLNDLFNSKYIVFVEGNQTNIIENSKKTTQMNYSEQKQYYERTYPLSITNTTAVHLVFFNPEIVMYEQNTTGMFAVVHAPILFNGSMKDAKEVISRWLWTELPLFKQFLVISQDMPSEEQERFPIVLSFTNTETGEKKLNISPIKDEQDYATFLYFWDTVIEQESNISQRIPANQCERSFIIKEQFVGDGTFSAHVEKKEANESIENCFLLLKTSIHPDWRALLITSEKEKIHVPIYYLSPSFMGIQLDALPPGEYWAVFYFPFTKLRQFLFLLSLGTLGCLFFVCHPWGIWISDKVHAWTLLGKENKEKQKQDGEV